MIGLATPYRVNNYGTKLQAYAVQTLVCDRNFEAEIIPLPSSLGLRKLYRELYAPDKVVTKLYKKVLNRRNTKSNPFANCDQNLLEKITVRYSAINSIDSNLLHIGKKTANYKELKEESAKYQAIICGSDQIWNPNYAMSDFWMLTYVPARVRTIALSPSFGSDRIPQSQRSIYRRSLNHFDFLSVREFSGQEIIKDLIGKTASVLLDPTLQLSRAAWDHFIGNTSNDFAEQKYIFCYFLGKNPIHRDSVRLLKQKTGCIIINMPHFKEFVTADVGFADNDLYDVSPEQFVKLIASARYVCTDSFHGTAFSIQYQKDVFVFERYASSEVLSTNTRIHSILDMFGMNDRLILDVEDIDRCISKITDYTLVNEIMSTKREEANAFLEKALAGL